MSNLTKNDWGSSILKDILNLNLCISLDGIALLSRETFKNILKNKINHNALIYLRNKIKSKGSEIKYHFIGIQNYLTPNVTKLSTKESQFIFRIRARMIDVKANFPQKYAGQTILCRVCGTESETQEHLLFCQALSENTKCNDISYNNIFGKETSVMKIIARVMKRNLEKREEFTHQY